MDDVAQIAGTTVAGPIDRFDDEARRVLALAQSEAVRLNQRSVGPEHLLLGLLREGDRVAAPSLKAAGVDGRRVNQAVSQMAGPTVPREELSEVVLSPQTTRVIALATEEADQLGAARVAPEHLLLGLVREPGNAGSILGGFGVPTETIRDEVLRRRRGD